MWASICLFNLLHCWTMSRYGDDVATWHSCHWHVAYNTFNASNQRVLFSWRWPHIQTVSSTVIKERVVKDVSVNLFIQFVALLNYVQVQAHWCSNRLQNSYLTNGQDRSKPQKPLPSLSRRQCHWGSGSVDIGERDRYPVEGEQWAQTTWWRPLGQHFTTGSPGLRKQLLRLFFVYYTNLLIFLR